MTGILAIILVFGGLIFFHELGHFLAARMFGMGVQTFSLGFGPALISHKPHKTRYQWALLPLGGYVALVGESDANDLPEGFTAEESFSLRPAWQRFVVIAAGPFFNLLLAWVLCWGLLYGYGEQRMLPVINEVVAEGAAQKAGLLSNDIVDSIDGFPIKDWVEILPIVQAAEGRTVEVEVIRAGTSMTFTVEPTLQELPNSGGETWVLGIMASKNVQTIHHTLLSSATTAFTKLGDITVVMWKGIVGLVERTISTNNLMGPIGIGKAIYNTSEGGVGSLISIAILISLNLGLLNLLPIPVLDGGHLMFLSFEMLTRRPVPDSIKGGAAFVGLALLLSLMVFATYNDIMRFF